MSILHRTRNTPDDSASDAERRHTGDPPADRTGNAPEDGPHHAPDDSAGKTTRARVPRTRMSAAWVGICVAVVTLVFLIIFMLQNTGDVEVTFLWLSGTLPLAMALLIAGVGTGILAVVIGAARITQLRRLSRRDHQ